MPYLDSSSTYAEVEAAYRDNASYDVQNNVEMARFFIDACRQLLERMRARMKTGEGEVEQESDAIQKMLDNALTWLSRNDSSSTTRAKSSVVHLDFRQYR